MSTTCLSQPESPIKRNSGEASMNRLVIAQNVAAGMKSASFIREMFERGRRLKAEFGEDKVFDFSLGNPNGVPPAAFFNALEKVARERNARLHRYMPNAGFDETRAAVARFVAREYNLDVDGASVVLTCGAAAGLNVVMRALCDPGDEVILLAPFFPEYPFYVQQTGATPVIVQTDDDFQPDIARIEAALTPQTRAIIVNSPNNPTGVLYTEQCCRALGDLLRRFERPERPIYQVLDDPYRRLVFDVPRGPTPASHYARTMLVSSYSKDLSIPGERCGYIAVPAGVPERALVLNALIMLNRTLGFVNMPAFMQRVLVHCADACCDISGYRAARDQICAMLRDCGYDVVTPGGGMFVFPRTPIPDDRAFTDLLVRQRVLAVPGSGFGRPGYMRLSFAVEPRVIEGARAGLKAAREEALRH